MLCLTCATENAENLGSATNELSCKQCSAPLGVPTQTRGYLPQLKMLEQQLVREQIDDDQADLRLERFEQAMHDMLEKVDALSTKLLDANLDELQLASVSNYIQPLRSAIINLRDLGNALTLDVPWSGEVWLQLEEAQKELLKGFQLQAQLLQMLAIQAMKGGISMEQLKAMRVNQS
jgi:hypothetical protein